jgi:hypothetical protein
VTRVSLVFLLVAVAMAVLLLPRSAAAYPWMIRHGYTQCATCHADPSGGGLLVPYGRAQGEILLRMRYGSSVEREPSRAAEPMFGVLPLPSALLVGGSVRSLHLRRFPAQGASSARTILMQADLLGQIELGRLRASASMGYIHEGALPASITRGAEDRLVSRVHWAGADLGREREWLVRAGRMNLPFGLRSIEHVSFVRAETRTDINAAQQHGASIAYHRGPWRGELMAVLGNFQIAQDRFRSRGYAGFLELAPSRVAAVGVSSLALHTDLDPQLLTPSWRQAHGVFARYSPERAVVLGAEIDALHTSQPTPGRTAFGSVGQVTVDFEPVQGLHLAETLEVLLRDFDERASIGLWSTAWWFFLPHADVRLDFVSQRFATPAGSTPVTSLLAQLHFYL